MHEIMILNIIKGKLEDAKNKLTLEFKEYLNEFCFNKISEGGYNTTVDCATRISLYFKRFANTDNEGVDLEVHINKSKSYSFEIELSIIDSAGREYDLSIFSINLIDGKESNMKILSELERAINTYCVKIKEMVHSVYLTNK